MNHSEVAHNWAHDNYNRNGELNGNRMYATEHNRTIYSYGSHFPIARKTDNPNFPVFMTYRGYSNSTSKHIGHVWSALAYRTVFMCHCPGDSELSIYSHEMREHVPELIESLHAAERREKMWRSRVEKREARGDDPSDQLDRNLESAEEDVAKLSTEIRDRIEELERFRLAFNIKLKDCDPAVRTMRDRYRKGKWHSIPQDMEKMAERARKKRIAEAAAEEKRRREQEAENLERWLKGETVRLYYQSNPAKMRVHNGQLQTTLGASVSVEEAAKAIRFIDMVRKHRDSLWQRNGETFRIGPFPMDSITKDGVVVGCHRFTFEEIDRIKPQVVSHHYNQQPEEVTA